MAGISGINNNNSLYSLTQLLNNQSSTSSSEVDSLTSLVGSDVTASEKSANSVIFSTQGQVYNRLQQLQKSDPEKFKKVCAEIAAELTAASKKNAGTGAAELAAKFVSAAESGKMTDLTATTTTDTTSTTSTSESNKTTKAKNALSQYYQQYTATKSSGNSDIATVIQSLLDSLGSSI